MDYITHSQCPVCAHENLTPHLECEDHLVSHQKFRVEVCRNCGLGMTQGVPPPNNIGAFYKSENYISHSDTRKGLVNSLYHQIRTFMLGLKQRLVEKHTGGQKGSLLDIGCGTGYFLHHMKKHGWTVHGTEPDPDARAMASSQLDQEIGDSNGLFDLPAQSYDAITMWHVLEHVYELDQYLQQISILLKQEGTLVIAVPNYLSYDAQLYQEHWAAFDVPRHLWHFSPASLVRLVEPYGFELVTRQRMPFDPFYIAMVSEKYRQKGWALARGLINGGLSFCHSLVNLEKSSSLIYVFHKRSQEP